MAYVDTCGLCGSYGSVEFHGVLAVYVCVGTIDCAMRIRRDLLLGRRRLSDVPQEARR